MRDYLQWQAKNFDKAIQFNQNYTEAYIENGKVNLEMRKIDAASGQFYKSLPVDSLITMK